MSGVEIALGDGGEFFPLLGLKWRDPGVVKLLSFGLLLAVNRSSPPLRLLQLRSAGDAAGAGGDEVTHDKWVFSIDS
jgi:hypothetical protein